MLFLFDDSLSVEELIDKCRSFQIKLLLGIWTPCSFAIIIFASWMSYIGVRSNNIHVFSAPVLPVPKQSNATLLLLLYWIKKEHFSDINDGHNVCDCAYYFIVVYAVLNVLNDVIS